MQYIGLLMGRSRIDLIGVRWKRGGAVCNMKTGGETVETWVICHRATPDKDRQNEEVKVKVAVILLVDVVIGASE